MKVGRIIGLAIGLIFAFVVSGAVLGIAAPFFTDLNTAVGTGGALEAYATQISATLTGMLSGAMYAGKLAPLAVLVAIFGVDRYLASLE